MKEVFMTYKLPDAAVAKIEQHFSVAVGTEDRHLTKEEIIDGAKGKQALVTLLSDNVDREVIEALPQLEVIANYAVGTNNIDIAGATEKRSRLPIPLAYLLMLRLT